jgi:hypothetical protein
LEEPHIPRAALVELIIDTADVNQHVVISSPPATGKTSLLVLLTHELETRLNGGRVLFFYPQKTGSARTILDQLETYGIPTTDIQRLKKVPPTWIIIDDAQRGYSEECDDLWSFLVKDVKGNKNIKVIIAATYDMVTLGSPAALGSLEHVFENFTGDEVSLLIQQFCSRYPSKGWANWEVFWLMVKDISALGTNYRFHVGVVVKCLKVLESFAKSQQPTTELNEDLATRRMHQATFLGNLDRCFAINQEMIASLETRTLLTSLLVGQIQDGVPQLLAPLVRAGVLSDKGRFSCQAALWFYNTIYFNGRALAMPTSLEDLIVKAVCFQA